MGRNFWRKNVHLEKRNDDTLIVNYFVGEKIYIFIVGYSFLS